MPTPLFRASPVVLLRASLSASGTRLDREPGLVRVRAGVYAEAVAWHSLPPWDRYLARVHAYALIDPGAVFSHESAAALWGLPLFGEPRDIHVWSARRSTSTRYGDVLVHTSRTPRCVDEDAVCAATSLEDTAVDLGRCLPPAFGLAVWDATVRRAHDAAAFLARLTLTVGAHADARGRRRLAWIEQHVDPRSESVGESVSRAVISWLGFPAPRLQEEFFFEGVNDRGDFFWPHARVLGESDGYGKYADADAERVFAHLRREKTREDRLRRHMAAVARWDWHVAMQGWPLGDRLHAAGLRASGPTDHAALATLRRHPRSLPRETQPAGRGSARGGESHPPG